MIRQKIKRAFTLVELIVVITVLGILSTIGFVSYSSYLTEVRDSNRVSNLKAIADGLEIYRSEAYLPLPEDKIEVRANGEIIAWQGYAGENVLNTIEFSNGGKDPLDDKYYSYYLTKDKKSYQLMAFLEEQDSVQDSATPLVDNLTKKTNAVDYSYRYPTVYGKKLGILVEDSTNTPVQEVSSVISAGYIDVGTTTYSYDGYLIDNFKISGTGSELVHLKALSYAGGLTTSCKKLLETAPKLQGNDGEYYITLDIPTKVYCDMTDDGGGRTRYVKVKGNYSFEEALKCWKGKYSSSTIDCFNPNMYSFVVSGMKIKVMPESWASTPREWHYDFPEDRPSKIYRSSNLSRYCRGGVDYMVIMSEQSDGYPADDFSNVKYVRLGKTYCKDNDRELGGKAAPSPIVTWNPDRYMNYSLEGRYGPWTGDNDPNTEDRNYTVVREDNAFKSELYIR